MKLGHGIVTKAIWKLENSLVNWVKSNISEDPGHFQSTTTLYKAYCEETPQDQVVTETAFVQQIENIMSALMLNPAKRRFNKVRGYVGVILKRGGL